MKRLIYAAYGSNLLRERFMYYIKGGRYRQKCYKGSRDTTDPVDLGYIFVPHRLYFAKRSPNWDNKGVAFLSPEIEPSIENYAIVRLWMVSEFQFEDIHAQEGKCWYNIILNLGCIDGLEVKTFTGYWIKEINPPSNEYLKVIEEGLKETTRWPLDEIRKYLNKFTKMTNEND